MIRRFLLILCLLLIVAAVPRLVLAWAGTGTSLEHVELHADGTPCHDDGGASAPCDDGCSCVCCATVRVSTPPVLAIAEWPSDPGELLPPSELAALHPVPSIYRLYRPPRA